MKELGKGRLMRMFPLLSGWPVRYRQRVIPFLSAPPFRIPFCKLPGAVEIDWTTTYTHTYLSIVFF